MHIVYIYMHVHRYNMHACQYVVLQATPLHSKKSLTTVPVEFNYVFTFSRPLLAAQCISMLIHDIMWCAWFNDYDVSQIYNLIGDGTLLPDPS